MKIRTGFVSNSSSSSFILNDKYISLKDFKNDIKFIWNTLSNAGHCSKENLVNVSCFLDLRFYSKKSKKQVIERLYSNECYGANSKINYEYISKYDPLFEKVKKFFINLFSKTYLQEAMKADIFGTSQENEIPYEVLEAVKEKYGSKLVIHHLG